MKITKTKIKTKGMTCNACEMLIVDAIGELEGITKVQASHNLGIVEVDYDCLKTNLGEIKKTIKVEGFSPE
jgi:copper chaperone CopZ